MSKQSKFSSKLGFTAAAAGSAVGLYNMWRFPYEAGAHGGAGFLLVYLICVALVGYPLVVAELALGRNTQLNAQDAFIKTGRHRLWGWMGLAPIVVVMLIMAYYNVVSGWIVGYSIEAIKGNLLQVTDFGTYFSSFRENVPNNLMYTFLMILAGSLIVRGGVQDGLEKWAKILMPLFVFMLLGLIGYALTLENAWEGVKFYLIPDFKALLSWKTLSAVLGQSFVSLSVGLGILTTYGGYLRKEDDIPSSAGIIVGSDTTVSFLAGMILFPFIFHQHMIPDQGPGLLFISLPKVFQSFGPVLGAGIGTTFFVLFVLAALTSSISIFETLTKYVEDRYQISRKSSVMGIAALAYLGSIPSILGQGSSKLFTDFITIAGKKFDFLSFLDLLCAELLPPILCFVFSLFVAYRWKTKNMLQEALGEPDKRPLLASYLNISIGFICPILLGVVSIVAVINLLK